MGADEMERKREETEEESGDRKRGREEGMDERRRRRRRRVCIRDKRLDLRRWDHTCDDDDEDDDEDDDDDDDENGYESMFSGYPGQFLVVPEAADISLQRGVRNIRRIALFFSSFSLSMIPAITREGGRGAVLNEVDQWTEGAVGTAANNDEVA